MKRRYRTVDSLNEWPVSPVLGPALRPNGLGFEESATRKWLPLREADDNEDAAVSPQPSSRWGCRPLGGFPRPSQIAVPTCCVHRPFLVDLLVETFVGMFEVCDQGAQPITSRSHFQQMLFLIVVHI